LSGGIDSTIATIKRILEGDFAEVQPIFINYGQRACEQEWESACVVTNKMSELFNMRRTVFHSPKRIDLYCPSEGKLGIFQWSKSKIFTGSSKSSPYVENRNLILLSVAASFVESQIGNSDEGIIVTGFRDEYPDTQREFVALLNCLLSFLVSKTKKTIRVEAPIIGYGPDGKARMIRDFEKYLAIIKLTWSCYFPKNGKPCQKCEACRDRKESLGIFKDG
jgi:7-cyano-7-deazaguanine synthase